MRNASRPGLPGLVIGEKNMTVTALEGSYKLKYYDYNTFQIDEIMKDTFYPDDWMDTRVPEDVRTALKRYGYIDGYYYGKDLDKERWIEEKDWVYYHTFHVEKERETEENTLCFEGIDTIARIWLNGICLGMCRNMYLEYAFDVTQFLRYGQENCLVIQVLSPLGYTSDMSREGIYPEDDTTRMLLRKSQMNWGWDFCGHCLTTGIWKPVLLKSRDHAVLHETQLITEGLEGDSAELRLRCSVMDYIEEKQDQTILLELQADGEKVFARELTRKEAEDFSFTLDKPRLWWPRPYGDPFLYEVRICLRGENGVLDERSFRFGIRTVELIQEKDEGGRSFLFCVNGKRLFIRGANWVPLNCVYGEIRDEEYDYYIGRIVDSNISMLRIWGGGIYESEHFLDACDEKGIMIFQDMMLACGIFPQDAGFLQEVFEETGVIVRKNINRTCIMIWSADNELDEAYRWYDMLDRFRENKVNREAVRKGVEENDSSRPFLVSSPCSPFEQEEGGEDPNSDKQGDMHLYLTRFLKNDEYYYKKILELKPRFMSEYGFSSLPWEPSYYRFNFRREPVDLVRNPWLAQLDWLREVGEKGDVSEIIYYSQFTHAQGLKYWIEYLRSLKWHCGGSLYWKFNDPIAPNRENMLFPSLMSCIDFFRLPKLAYYYARRAYEDKILAFREDLEGNLAVYGCNETDSIADGTLCVSLKTYGGETVWCDTVPCIMDRDHASLLYRIPAERLADGPSCSCYVYAAFAAGEERLVNLFHLTEVGEWNQVEMPRAALKAELREAGDNTLEITVSADSFVQDVTIEILDEDVYYSDNSFCLEKGERAVIQAKLTASGRDGGKMRIRAYNADPVCGSFSLGGNRNEVSIR